MIGHHIGPAAGAQRADVDGVAGGEIGQRVQRHHLPAERQCGAAALLWLDTRVRRAARHFQAEEAAPAPLADNVAVLAPGLQHQHSVGARRLTLEKVAAARRADFFIRGADQSQPAEPIEATAAQRLDRVDRREEAGFHVTGAGSQRAVALDTKRARGRRAMREDGVQMGHQRNPRAPLPVQRCGEAVGEVAAGVLIQLGTPARATRLDPGRDALDIVAVVGAGIQVDQRLEVGQEGGHPRRELMPRGRGAGGGFGGEGWVGFRHAWLPSTAESCGT